MPLEERVHCRLTIPGQPLVELFNWQYLCIGNPHCLPFFLHLPHAYRLLFHQQGFFLSITGSPLLFSTVNFFRLLMLAGFRDGHFIFLFPRFLSTSSGLGKQSSFSSKALICSSSIPPRGRALYLF